MKILMALIILGTIARTLIAMPATTLPKYPIHGTEKIEVRQETQVSRAAQLRGMSEKMHYLKTGRSIGNARNRARQDNFWGKGVSADTKFPTHLVAWEEFRRTGKK